MIGEVMHVTSKELFYSAMMLRLERLVNVEYLFPTSEDARALELNEAKKTLRNKKLLKESANGDISLDLALTACAVVCAKPETCEVKSAGDYYATAYRAEDVYMLMEREPDDILAISWFADKTELDDHVTEKLNMIRTEDDEVDAEN